MIARSFFFFSGTELHEPSREKGVMFCLQVRCSYWNMDQLTIVLVYGCV